MLSMADGVNIEFTKALELDKVIAAPPRTTPVTWGN